MSEINANRIGGLWDGETKHQAGSVWDINGLSPTIDTMLGGGREPHIMEIWNVRNIYINSREGRRAWVFENGCNSSHGNWGGIAHTVTCREGALCVQHCNLIIEVEKLEEVKVIGNYMPSEHNASRVVDDKGIAPTVMENHGTVTGVVEIQELGGLEEGSSQRRKVFDENGVSPTLQAAMGSGGGNVPLVVDAVIGFMQENAMVGNGEYSPSLTEAMGMGGGQIPMVVEKSSVVIQKCGDRDKDGSYSVHDYSNTIPANPMSDRGQMLVEQTCVAMRGRNPENPSDRTPGIELEQRLEVNDTGCTNTLTTVQKDNLVLEKSSFPLRMVRTEEGKALRKDYEAGNIHHGFNEYREPECRTDGVSNTVTTDQKDTLLLEKEQVLAYDEQNQTVRSETFGTLTTDGSSPKHNNRVIKIKQATKQGFIECEIGGVFCSEYPTSELRRGRVIENGQISPTLTTESIPDRIELGNPDFYNFLYEIDGEIYLIRIRKLIPLECWRLMGFTDEDFYKAEKVNSNTQLYKQAGNSIVCDCLEAIFSQMNIKGVTPWNEKQEFTYQDLLQKIRTFTQNS